MLRLSNISIGIKLAIMSGIAILVVGIMITSQMLFDSAVGGTVAQAIKSQTSAVLVANVKSAMRGMQIGVNELRLATTIEDIKKANDYLNVHQSQATTYVGALLQNVRLKEQVERAQRGQSLIEQFAAGAKEVSAARTEILALRPKDGSTAGADVADRLKSLDEKLGRTVRERTLLAAQEFETLSSQMEEVAKASAGKSADAATQKMASSEYSSLALGVVVCFVLIGSAVFGSVSIARPLKAMVAPLVELASGNFQVVVPGVGRKDEVGQIADAVAEMAARVSSTIGEIKASGREVTNASAEISTSTTDLSQRTEEQAASLEETSAAMEELSATVKKNAENAQQASQSANSTRDVADRGGQVVAKAVEAMAKIEDSSRKISDIIGVIDEIARQTNLLALNAAVEAARAGEAGRGFAVVASEVRSLAQRSSQAAKDIKDLITNSNGQVKDGVELVSRAGASLTEIVESIKGVATIVAEIANASIEQATGIDQINKALTQMDEVTQQNSALVEENAATAKTLEHQAKAMDEQVAYFQIGDAGDKAQSGHVREQRREMDTPSRGPAAKLNRRAAA